jgi:hypothetical protein
MNGIELGRQVARAAIAAQTLDEITNIMARMTIRAMMVDMMAKPPFSDIIHQATFAAGGFATGGLVKPGSFMGGREGVERYVPVYDPRPRHRL